MSDRSAQVPISCSHDRLKSTSRFGPTLESAHFHSEQNKNANGPLSFMCSAPPPEKFLIFITALGILTI